eukprot:4352276-Amphidinium_carterae.1
MNLRISSKRTIFEHLTTPIGHTNHTRVDTRLPFSSSGSGFIAEELSAQVDRCSKTDKHCDVRDPVNHHTPDRAPYF